MEGVKPVRIALLGFGTVGQGIWAILQEQADHLTVLLGWAPEVAAILVRDANKPRDVVVPRHLLVTSPADILSDNTIDVLLEATGDTQLGYQLVKQALLEGKHVVTASKALLSQHMEELSALAAHRGCHLLYEASVCGGMPLIKPLKDLPQLGEVISLRGIINGSCNYILHAMQQGKSYETAVDRARQLGYLEADASSDVKGWDARRKLRILASLAFGGSVLEEQILCHGIDRVALEDVKALWEAGYAVRLLGRAVCSGGQVAASVLPWALPQGTVLAGVQGADNLLEVEAQYLGRLCFGGPGAGRFPTAHAMVNDLLDVIQNRQPITSPLGDRTLVPSAAGEKLTFYLRGEGWQKDHLLRSLGNGWVSRPLPLGDVLEALERDPSRLAIAMEYTVE
ncbi:MAG: homoserine dehydrogenase [Clostridiales bacterium]|nr:homoserine dehydrogenase [Clostridiales bacterium]